MKWKAYGARRISERGKGEEKQVCGQTVVFFTRVVDTDVPID